MAANALGPAALGCCKGDHNQAHDLLFRPVLGQLRVHRDQQFQQIQW